MRKITLHALAAAGVAAGAASLALAVDAEFDITRPGPDRPAPFSAGYRYKVKGTRAKGGESYHMSVGTSYVSAQGVYSSGSLEASRHDRPSFFAYFFAPTGDGSAGESAGKVKWDSERAPAEESSGQRTNFASNLVELDSDLGGVAKRPPVPLDGTVNVERLRIGGSYRVAKGELSGSLRFVASGTVTTGPNAGKPFKATFKVRLRRAPQLALEQGR